MKYANISNNMYVNQYDGETRITCFGMTPAGVVDLFSVPISTPSGQVQISKEPILGKTRAINDIMQKQGNLGGSTSGEVQIATKTASFAIKNDYAYLSPVGVGIELSRNTLEAILSGDGFYDSLNSVYRKVVGTNGAIKKSTVTDQNYIFKKLFEIDGRLRVADAATDAGHAITMKNIRTPAYDKSCLYMVFENISKYDDDNIDGVRVVYTMNSEVSVGDATDANEVSFTQTQLCDVRNVKNFLAYGFADDEVGLTVPARPSMVVKTGMATFKAKVTDVADIAVDAASKKIQVTLDVPTNIIQLNSTTQEYETAVYTPAAKDIAVVYIPKTTLQEFVDNTDTVKVNGSAYAIAIYNGTKWELADAGKVKESKILDGTAVTAGTFAVPATPTPEELKAALATRVYETLTWNFEKAAFEYI